MKFRFVQLLLAMMIGFGTLFIPAKNYVQAAAPVLEYGDRYGYVWGLQHRLQQLGLYKGKVDGIFGPLTQQAVFTFQRRHGLIVDGIVGPVTWHALREVTFTKEEIQMMAQLVYGEARGEPLKGKVAVAAVVLNRIASPKFPDTVAGVIFEPGAFTAVRDGQYYLQPEKEAYRAVYLAIAGWDPTNGALYYFNPAKASSDWIWSRPQVARIGSHIFAK